jgi:hypothetical protein
MRPQHHGRGEWPPRRRWGVLEWIVTVAWLVMAVALITLATVAVVVAWHFISKAW